MIIYLCGTCHRRITLKTYDVPLIIDGQYVGNKIVGICYICEQDHYFIQRHKELIIRLETRTPYVELWI